MNNLKMDFSNIPVLVMFNIFWIVGAEIIPFCPTPPTTLQRYTASCDTNSECVTNYCYNKKCACPSGTYYQDCKFSCVPNCGANNIRTIAGDLVSRGYPFTYYNSEHCTWTLYGNPNTYFVFSITDIDLEDSCSFDSLEIYNGSSTSSPRLALYCQRNDTTVKVVATSTNVMHIVFKTDASRVYRGFGGSYRLYDINAKINKSDFGYIASPGYPLKYPRSSYFTWTIDGGHGKFISFRMMTFYLESESNCGFDYVQVFDGPSSSSKSLAKLCSRSYPPVIMSSASYLHIVFKTDSSNEFTGFVASYLVNDCHTTLSNNSGYIISPGFPAQYRENLFCTWTITAPPDKDVFFSISDFQLENSSNCAYDYLKIYDGRSASAPLLGTFCNRAPPTIVSTTNVMFLMFKTNGINNFRGFNGTFTIERPYDFKCNISSQCKADLECVAGKCICRPDFYFDNITQMCCHALGHGSTCDTHIPKMCSGPSLECKNDRYGARRCLCSSNLFREPNVCLLVPNPSVVLSNDSQITTNDVHFNWTSSIQSTHINCTIAWRANDNTLIGGEKEAHHDGVHVSGLIPGQEYIFTVVSKLEAYSYYPETHFSTHFPIETRPATPGKLNVNNSHLMSSPYILRFEPSEGRTSKYCITLNEKVYNVNTAELNTTDLAPDTQYIYRITAYNKHGDSSDVVIGNFTTGREVLVENDMESDVNIPLIAGVTVGVLVVVIISTVVVTLLVRRRKQNRSKDRESPKMTDTYNNDVITTVLSTTDSSGDIQMTDYRDKTIVDNHQRSIKDTQDERFYDTIRDSEITDDSGRIYMNVGNTENGKRLESVYNNFAYVKDQH